MVIVFLDRVDAAPLDNEDFSYVFNAWVANTIDSLNETIIDVENQLNGLGFGAFITPKTTAEITALIDMNAKPLLPLGTMWFDTTIGKLKVLTTMAVTGFSNGVTQTVTSV